MKQNQSGFTVVELIITLMVVAGAFVLVTNAFATATRLSDRNDDMLAANSSAYAILQQYENRSFINIEGEDDDPEDPTITYTEFTDELPNGIAGPKSGHIYVKTITPSLKYLFVRITYHSSTGEQNLEYGTMVQSGGLGR